MQSIHDYDPELQKYVKLTRLGKIKITPRIVRIANFIGKPRFIRLLKDADLSSVKYKIKGYKDTPLDIICYTPKGIEKVRPAILFFHGGAFMLNGFEHSRNFARIYAREIGARVFFVDYHLAFKYPYPYAIEDAYLALEWVFKSAKELMIDKNRIAVIGDSAGGFIAAALSQLSKDRNGPKIKTQMLIYPVIDSKAKTKSMEEFDDTPGWNSRLNRQMCDIYFKDPEALGEYTTLLDKDCSNLAPAYVEAHEFDCLRDEAIEYAKNMGKSGTDVTLKIVKGSFHGADLFSKTEIVKNVMEERFVYLKEKLSD